MQRSPCGHIPMEQQGAHVGASKCGQLAEPHARGSGLHPQAALPVRGQIQAEPGRQMVLTQWQLVGGD